MRRMTAACAAGVLVAAVGVLSGQVKKDPSQAPVVRIFGDWSLPLNLESVPGTHPDLNTTALDGCPSVSKNHRSLFMASTRPDGEGGIDIWIAERDGLSDPWGEPRNAGAPVNSASNDFCPTPLPDGVSLMFVSNRPHADACGGADLYLTRRLPTGGWEEPQNLGCEINSAGDEFSPSLITKPDGQTELWFSSNREGGLGLHDIYFAVMNSDGSFQTPQPAHELNSTFDDARPNVRRDGREIVFDSTRPGGKGASDIWAADRRADGTWTEPYNLWDLNSDAAEARVSFSWDGQTIYFGSNRPGSEAVSGQPVQLDIYFATRQLRQPLVPPPSPGKK